MIHYVLTRSAYPAAYPLEANRRRLELTRHITARSLAAQTERRWRWVVTIDLADPLLEQRMDVLRAAGVPLITVPVKQRRVVREVTPDGQLEGDVEPRAGGPYRRAIEPEAGDERILTTRLDDDDALAIDALARIRAAAERDPGEHAWIMPHGFRWHRARVCPMTHTRNMFASLDSPRHPLQVVVEAKHNVIDEHWPVRFVDREPGWLWVRHADARSGSRRAEDPLTPRVAARFDVDWAYLEGVR